MQFYSILREVTRSLRRNKLRSVLTMLGIVMGVAAFICVVGMGNAGSAKIEDQLKALGDNMIWLEAGSRSRGGVRTGSRGTRTLIMADAYAIVDQIPTVKRMSPNIDGHIQVASANLNWNTTYRGITPDYLEIRRWMVKSGTFFTQQDVENTANVCVLGQTVVDNLFRGEEPVGQTIRINSLPCRVVATLMPKGASATGQDQDDFILVPVTTAQKKISGNFWLDDVYFSATSDDVMPQTRDAITALLRERHHIRPNEDPDFNIRSPEDLINAQLAASRVFTLLLASAASIALLVGGIGIMNIMLVSVTERTREIGIRLAIGATDADVQLQFLAEALALSLMGGVIGVFAGYLAAQVLRNTLQWDVQITLFSASVGGIFSTLIGIMFGFYPARKASRLDPIQALRFE